MAKKQRSQFQIRPLLRGQYWISGEQRFLDYAKLSLDELQILSLDIKRQWPVAADQAIQNTRVVNPQLWSLCRKRDALSDAVKAFCAMSVEAFLNCYGVLRLSDEVFSEHFERLGLVPKLKVLLLICENVSVPESDHLVQTLIQIARRRNDLVHPKTREFEDPVPEEMRFGDPIPETAVQAFADMEKFYELFLAASPESATILPSAYNSPA